MSLSHRLEAYVPPPGPRRNAAPNRPLRILHLLSQQPAKTGSGVCLMAMIAHAAERGYRQRAVIGIPADEAVPPIPPLSTADIIPVRFGRPPAAFPIPGMSDVMPYRSTRFSEFTPDMREGYLAAFDAALTSATDGFRPDILHANHLWLMTALARSRFSDTPLCVQSHGTELRQLANAPHLAPFVVPACADVDMALALHPENRNRLIAAYGLPADRIRVVGAGFRDDLFCREGACALPREAGVLRVVYAGKLAIAKGASWLIAAMKRVTPPAGMRVTLHLAGSGSGPDAETIRAAAAGKPDINFLGALPQAELACVLRSADVFVLPSVFEGLPLVAVEAMACGCRIVITDLPGLDAWMPGRLLEQGYVERVPMPRMTGLDTPHPDDIPLFIDRLAGALSKQLHNAVTHQKRPGMAGLLGPLTWRGVFSRVDAIYRELSGGRVDHRNGSVPNESPDTGRR